MNLKKGKTTSISVAIITLNEEDRLPGCLATLDFAEEVVVVDSGSTDRTREIALNAGAKFFDEPWRGFSVQKQFAVDQCTNKWVLILDADERVPLTTATRIIEETQKESAHIGAYSLRRKNYLHGRWIKSCGWWPNRVIRLVNKYMGDFDGKNIHESWVTKDAVVNIDAEIDHLSFNNYADLIRKMDLYSNAGAISLHKQKKSTSFLTPLSHGLWMFFKTYLLELGFRDGFDGFVISSTNAGGSFFKYAKCRELEKNQNHRSLQSTDAKE